MSERRHDCRRCAPGGARHTSLVLVMFPAIVLAAQVQVSRVPHDGIQPQVIVEVNGAIDLLYFSGDPKNGDLFFMRSGSEPLRVNSQAGSAFALGTIRGGQIAVGANGRVHVAWNGSGIALPLGPVNPEAGKAGSPMLYSRLNDAGTAFEPQRNLMQKTFGLDGGGTLAADAEGNVFIGWHGKQPGAAQGEAGRQVWIANSHDSGKTFAEEAAAGKEPTGVCGCCGLAMFAARDGSLFALYRSATENVHRDIYLLASRDHGKSFSGTLVQRWEINACPMSSMSFAEGSGNVFAAWETGGQVFYGKIDGSEVKQIVAAPGEGKGRKHPRIAVNGRGEILLVWTEGTAWQRGGSLAWQLFDASGKAAGEKGSAAGVPVWSFGAVAARGNSAFTIIY
jgi:hypothetical protein